VLGAAGRPAVPSTDSSDPGDVLDLPAVVPLAQAIMAALDGHPGPGGDAR
jgi:hypothetical protein